VKTEEDNPQDWLRSARSRLASADTLYPIEGATEAVIELLQEATERFLKAYLIAYGWELRRIHDLGALVAEAVQHDSCFANFEEFADNLTDQFWAQHYPGGDLSEIGQDFPDLRRSLGEMIKIVETKLSRTKQDKRDCVD
jgi:HEPN domain-containing protein